MRLAQEHPACQAGWREGADRLLVSLPPGGAPGDLGKPRSRERGGGALDEVVVVSSGASDLRVWVTSQDRTVRAYATLEATIPAGEPKALELSLSGGKLALAVK